MGWDEDRERSLTDYCHCQNRLNLGKLVWFITSQIGVGYWEIKPNLTNTFPPTPPLFPGWTSPPNSLPPPSEGCRGMENGGCAQFITHFLWSSFLLTPFPCWSVRPLHGRQFSTNCSSMGSQVQPANLLRCGLLSPRGHSLLWASTCSSVGSLPWDTGGDLFPRGPSWLQVQSASPRCAPQAAANLCSGTWSTSSPPALTWGSAELFLSHVLMPPSHCKICCYTFFFSPLLKYVTTEVLPPLLIGLALASGK